MAFLAIDSTYLLECDDERQRLSVDESAMRGGARVEGPPLRARS